MVSPGGHYDAGSRRSSHSPSRSQGRSHSRSRSRRGESQGRSSRSKRRERSRSRSSHGSRRSRSRSQSQPQREAPQGSYTKGAAPSGRDSRSGLPGFDTRDRAPEDRMQHQTSTPYEADDRRSSQALVRGALRIEGVDFSKYEGLKEQPDLQRMFTTALRDDLISEGGNGMTRDDIMLRLSPGPIRTVVLDYNTQGAKRSGRPAAPSLVDAEWSMDVEYAISARDEHAQQNIARNLFESLSSQQMHLKSARTAYVRYVHAEGDPYKIVAVPCRYFPRPIFQATNKNIFTSQHPCRRNPQQPAQRRGWVCATAVLPQPSTQLPALLPTGAGVFIAQHAAAFGGLPIQDALPRRVQLAAVPQ